MTQHIFDAHCLLNEYMNLELLTITLNRWKMPLKNEDRQKKKKIPIMAQWKSIRLGTMSLRVRSLASLSGLRISHCCGCGVGQQL